MPNPIISLLIFLVIVLLLALFFWPDRGLILLWLRRKRMTKRVLIEDALRYIQISEFDSRPATLYGIAGVLNISTNHTFNILDRMSKLNLIQMKGDEIHLTPDGYDYAVHIIRAHRLWEQYLARETGYPYEELHRRAHDIEHNFSKKELDRLSLKLGNPLFDPHGDPIPSANGKMRPLKGQPLTSMPLNQPLQIIHLEDEPEAVYAQLMAQGLHPGMIIHLVDKTLQRIRFWSNGKECVLAPIFAANISVIPIQDATVSEKSTEVSLSELHLGEKAKIAGFYPVFRSIERRRLMDLGITPGTVVEANMRSASGDPTAYKIRGSLIALRQEQTSLINIEPINVAKDDSLHD